MAMSSLARTLLKMTIIIKSGKVKGVAAQPPLLSLFTPTGNVILSAAKDLLAIKLLAINTKESKEGSAANDLAATLVNSGFVNCSFNPYIPYLVKKFV